MPTFFTNSPPTVSKWHWDLHPDSTDAEMIINANRHNAKMKIIDKRTGGILHFPFKKSASVLVKKIEYDGGYVVHFFENALMDLAAPVA